MTKLESGALEQGFFLGPYKIVSKIGQGGMGNVYKAWDPGLKRYVAIKTLSESLMDNEEAAKRFMREAQSMAHLKHDNIVSIYFIDHEQSLYYFAMEFVEGETLSALIKHGTIWEVHELIDIIQQIVRGLMEAHRNNIIHRDLKPANIILDNKNKIRILDFGLSKLLTETSTLTAEGGILGTPDYMSPEQAQGIGVDYRTDIYSLGATLYHILSGSPPFTGSSPISVAVKHINEPLPPLKSLNTAIPDEIISMIYKMMSKKPALRYQSYEHILEDLETIEKRSHLTQTGRSFSTTGSRTATGTGKSAYTQTGDYPSHVQRTGQKKSISTKPVKPKSSKPYMVPPAKSKPKWPLIISSAAVICIAFFLIFKMSTDTEKNTSHSQIRSDHSGEIDNHTSYASANDSAFLSMNNSSSETQEAQSGSAGESEDFNDSDSNFDDTTLDEQIAKREAELSRHRDKIALKKHTNTIPDLFEKAQELFDKKTGPALSIALRDLLPTFETSSAQFTFASTLQEKASSPAEYALSMQALKVATMNSTNQDDMYEYSLRMMENAQEKAKEHNERVRRQMEEQERFMQDGY